MHTRSILLLLPLAALSLAACQETDQDFGHSVLHNRAVQTVDQQPVYAGVPMEGGDAVHAVDAQRRYLTGQVKELLKVDGKSNLGAQGGARDAGTGGTGRTSGTP